MIEGPDTDIDRISRSARDNGGKVSNELKEVKGVPRISPVPLKGLTIQLLT